MNDKIQATQLKSWLLVAMIAPILSMNGNAGWVGVLGTVLISVLITAMQQRLNALIPKWLGFIQLIWIGLYLGSVAKESISCWEIVKDPRVLAVALLALAGFAVMKGIKGCARSVSLLFWFVVPVTAIVLVAGSKDLNLSEIRMRATDIDWNLIPVFLLPAVGGKLSENGMKGSARCVIIAGGAALVVSALMDAALIPQVAIERQNAFYEYAKSATLFGVAKRFEAVSACLLTVGWFAFFTLIFSVAEKHCENIIKGSGPVSVWAVVLIAVLVMYNMHITSVVIGKIGLIFWGVLPLAAQVVERVKKTKNSTETC